MNKTPVYLPAASPMVLTPKIRCALDRVIRGAQEELNRMRHATTTEAAFVRGDAERIVVLSERIRADAELAIRHLDAICAGTEPDAYPE